VGVTYDHRDGKIIGMDKTLSDETREWMQVMQSLATRDAVLYEDLLEIGLSGLGAAVEELDQAGMVNIWGDVYVTYLDLLWL
jgi:hypothetical protein